MARSRLSVRPAGKKGCRARRCGWVGHGLGRVRVARDILRAGTRETVMRRKLMLWLGLVVVVAAFATPAGANTKQTTVVNLNFTQLAPLLTGACGFPIFETFDASFKIAGFF